MTLECTLDATVGDDAVEFAFAVTNAGDDPVDLQFSDACRADVAVEDDGQEVWRFSEGRMFAQMIVEETLAPGETETYTMAWEDPAPGDYEAAAALAARTHDCRASTSVSV